MNQDKEISIIVPVYNGEDFIESAYNFILSQGIEAIEILFIDNNSRDNSIEKISALQCLDKRVLFFQQPIQGAAAARNKGLENANGKYIYMLDVDDQIFPRALKFLKKVLDDYPKMDAVFGKMVKSHSDIDNFVKPKQETNEVIIKEKPYWGLKWFSDLKTVVGPPAFLYRKEVFHKIGQYELLLLTGQDTALDIKLGMHCNVAHIDRYIYLYLKHYTSTTAKAKKKNDRAFMQWPRYTKSHLPFYLEHDVPFEFKEILFKGIYGAMGRMINLTAGFEKRRKLKGKLLRDIEPLKTPWILKNYLNTLVLSNNPYIFKFYLYYLIPKLLPSVIKINDRQFKKA